MQPLLYFIFESLGLDRVSSALSGVIISLVPVAAMLFAVLFLKERPTVLQVVCTLGLIVATGAISILSNDGSKTFVVGIIYLVLAVVCAGLFNILSRSESKHYTAFERTYIMLLMGSVGYIILAFAMYGSQLIPTLSTAFCELEILIPMLYLGGLSSVGAFMLYNYSTTQITAVQSSSFSNVITVVTVVAGTVILKEDFSILEYALSAVILLGVFLVNKEKN
jgi:drug/metabolite transporter (DMT)-like permease